MMRGVRLVALAALLVTAVMGATVPLVPGVAARTPPPVLPGVAAPGEVSHFTGTATVFTGDPAAGLVLEASIGEGPARTLCGVTSVEADGRFRLDVYSAGVLRGCGHAGDRVLFALTDVGSSMLGGRPSAANALPAAPSAVFQPGKSVEIDLRRAPPPAGPSLFGRRETLRLPAGCTPVLLTWPTGTPASEVAGAVRSVLVPAAVPAPLVALWWQDVDGSDRAWSPQGGEFNDSGAVREGDTAIICVSAPAFLLRPVQ